MQVRPASSNATLAVSFQQAIQIEAHFCEELLVRVSGAVEAARTHWARYDFTLT